MDKIKVKLVMHPFETEFGRARIGAAFRLTQRGNMITSIDDMGDLLKSDLNNSDISKFTKFNHNVPQKFATITVAIYGVSRRFLAQITKHHEAVIVSTSLQYTKYGKDMSYVVPYDILNTDLQQTFLFHCYDNFELYQQLCEKVGHDQAAYMLPEATRCCLFMSATVPVWQHILQQRICKRNTLETRYVALLILKMFQEEFEDLFPNNKIRPCCNEFNLSCKNPYDELVIAKDILLQDFPKIFKEGDA